MSSIYVLFAFGWIIALIIGYYIGKWAGRFIIIRYLESHHGSAKERH